MRPRTENVDQISIRLDPELHQQIVDRAIRDDRTISQVIRVAVRRYLESTSAIWEAGP